MSRIIIKYNSRPKQFSPVYLMGPDPKDCIHGGILMNETIEVLIKEEIIKEVPHTEVIEKYFNHAGFLAHCDRSLYYELKPNK